MCAAEPACCLLAAMTGSDKYVSGLTINQQVEVLADIVLHGNQGAIRVRRPRDPVTDYCSNIPVGFRCREIERCHDDTCDDGAIRVVPQLR